jgi:hypothetical protein
MPEKPRPSDVSPPTNTAGDLIADPTEAQLLAVRYKSLDDNEREEYRQMQRDYEYERVKYDRCCEALAKIGTRIQSSVHIDKMHYTYNCDSVHEMLLKLRKRFAPTDTIREQELALAWKALQKLPKSQDIMAWLDKWETTYDECCEMDTVDVAGTRPIYSFIDAVQPLSSNFAETWVMKLANSTEAFDFKEVIQQYRNLRRTAQNWNKSKGGVHGAFASTAFQDRLPDGSRAPPSPCLCGELHW